ncbi:MAG: hypothetical protein H6622_13385 [Halobacteriovoraceae bacterium]|nr:hypothetical protein [Halobacteriovoraceae bacterium]
MNIENITLNIFGLIAIYFVLAVPLLTWFYLDKKYVRIKNKIIYNTYGNMYARFKVIHRFFGYITIFVFNDQSNYKNRNRLSHYLEPQVKIKDIVKIGTWEKVIGYFNIFIIFIFITDTCISYFLSKGWPINYLYGIERSPTTLQMYHLTGLAVTLIGATIYYSYKFIKKRRERK